MKLDHFVLLFGAFAQILAAIFPVIRDELQRRIRSRHPVKKRKASARTSRSR